MVRLGKAIIFVAGLALLIIWFYPAILVSMLVWEHPEVWEQSNFIVRVLFCFMIIFYGVYDLLAYLVGGLSSVWSARVSSGAAAFDAGFLIDVIGSISANRLSGLRPRNKTIVLPLMD